MGAVQVHAAQQQGAKGCANKARKQERTCAPRRRPSGARVHHDSRRVSSTTALASARDSPSQRAGGAPVPIDARASTAQHSCTLSHAHNQNSLIVTVRPSDVPARRLDATRNPKTQNPKHKPDDILRFGHRLCCNSCLHLPNNTSRSNRIAIAACVRELWRQDPAPDRNPKTQNPKHKLGDALRFSHTLC